MTFVRELGVKVTVPARRLGAGRRHDRPGVGQRARDRGLSGTVSDARGRTPSICTTARRRRCAACRSTAEPGKVTCVLGRNGVGKTSLLRALVGQQPIRAAPSCSTARTSRDCKPYERARRGIAFVPQGREIFPLLTVEENLETGFAPLERDDRAASRRRVLAVSGAGVDAAAGAAAISPAASSSSSPSAARW